MCRDEGILATADRVESRLRELGQRVHMEEDPEDARRTDEELKRARADLASWTKQAKHKEPRDVATR